MSCISAAAIIVLKLILRIDRVWYCAPNKVNAIYWYVQIADKTWRNKAVPQEVLGFKMRDARDRCANQHLVFKIMCYKP